MLLHRSSKGSNTTNASIGGRSVSSSTKWWWDSLLSTAATRTSSSGAFATNRPTIRASWPKRRKPFWFCCWRKIRRNGSARPAVWAAKSVTSLSSRPSIGTDSTGKKLNRPSNPKWYVTQSTLCVAVQMGSFSPLFFAFHSGCVQRCSGTFSTSSTLIRRSQ